MQHNGFGDNVTENMSSFFDVYRAAAFDIPVNCNTVNNRDPLFCPETPENDRVFLDVNRPCPYVAMEAAPFPDLHGGGDGKEFQVQFRSGRNHEGNFQLLLVL